ncbi:DUF6443 domain-containing protein, partial [Winogradskyella sp.]|uniref:DUF6443 domain-containing protein n=1 Tax=Winogradskyella sp. TaxID=1883156 RepID=UPI001B0CC688
TREYGAAPPTLVTDLNYVHNITPRVATTNTNTLGNTEKIEAVSYFDGLGRARQSVAIRAGGNSEDIITHMEYDEFGRNVKEYLPYSSTADIGTYRVDALDATNTYYDGTDYDDDFPGMTTADINPYSEMEFDNSPLNRVMKQAAPGKDWKLGNGHEIEMDYLTNTSSTEVRYYSVGLTKSTSNNVVTYTPTLQMSGYYSANELHKTITKDENYDGSISKLHTTEEFKNNQGQVILKRTYALVNSAEEAHDTYYIYDDYGNLSFVLPPKSEPQTEKPDATELSELCYQYKYDDRNRLVEKKIPGKGWEYIVYNKLDQPVITQDANLRAQGKWLFTAYDVFGRVVYTGKVYRPTWGRQTMQNHVNTGSYLQFSNKLSSSISINGVTIYYPKCFTNTTYINDSDIEVLTINYYDDYVFDLDGGTSETAYGVTPTTNVKGLATGIKVRVLGTSDWITTVTYFDDKARPIYVYSNNNYLDTKDKVKSDLTFDGRAIETTTTHDKVVGGFWNPTITVVDNYTYDDVNRLTEHRQKVNNAALEEVIATNTYDGLGQLIDKGVGGKQNASRLQDVKYSYNVRGWLKAINDPSNLGTNLFGFGINYNSVDHSGTKLYNGNIAETEWKTKSDNILRWYKYGYDALNRIEYGTANNSNYNLTSVAYDKNGNITNLDRKGHTNAQATTFGNMDNLVYTYETSSNRLKKVLDNGENDFGFKDGANLTTEYTYDDNGNMLSDANKDITSIDYNHLNLPTNVNFVSGDISYIYDATGVKLKKILSTGTTTEYAGNFIYEDGTLKMFSQPEGYVEPVTTGKATTYVYAYQYKDHLDNIRLTYSDSDKNGSINSSTEIIEENNYYPFGLKHKGYNDVVSANANSMAVKFGFNGMELEDSDVNGDALDLYEMDMRQYDPAIARWTSIDPVVHYSMSTYTAFDNNPIYWADPSGADSMVNWIGNYGPSNRADETGGEEDEDIGRNENNEIVYVTDGTQKTIYHGSGISAKVEIGYTFTNDGTPIKVYKNISSEKGFDTDCHGLTFVEGKYWIDNDEVRKILKGDGYKEIADGSISEGDVVTQEDSKDNIHHSSTVSCTDGTCRDSSSYGIGGVQTEPIDRPIEETEKIMERATKLDLKNKFYRTLATDRIFTKEEIKKLKQKVYPKLN